MLDTAKHTIDETGEYDETDIFSPLLPPDRRVVDSKEDSRYTRPPRAAGFRKQSYSASLIWRETHA